MNSNKIYNIFVCALLSVFCHTGMKAQSTVGTDFWVTFLPNYDVVVDELSLIATGNDSCTGIVTNPYTGWSTSFTVVPGAITNIHIPQSEAYSYHSSDSVKNKVLHVTTTDSISLYASNFEEYSFDITNVLPTPSLGSDYVIQTYETYPVFSIVATEDSTTVVINLTDNSLHHNLNAPYVVRLNAGQCCQFQSRHVNIADFSGSTVFANDNKKIAVFAGNKGVNVPITHMTADHLFEQMMPTSSWGNKFVVTNSMLRENDRVRIMALNDNCRVEKDGELLTTLSARQIYEFEITNSNPVVYLETSEPACVFLYLTSVTYGGMYGDPSMVVINPINQRIKDVTFSTFTTGTSIYTDYLHYVNIVTMTSNIANMTLDGNNISSNFSIVPSKPEYSYARIGLNHGAHTLSGTYSAEENGFIAHVYGLAECESYCYSVGSMVVDIPPKLILNGLFSVDYPDGFEVCGLGDSNFVFDLELNYIPSNVVWHFGDGTTAEGYPVTNQYAEAGNYNVSCDIYRIHRGTESLDTTITTILTIHSTYDTTLSASICLSGVYADNGFVESEAGIYVNVLKTIYGCDSVVRLDLTINPLYDDTIYAHVCDGDVYDQLGFYGEGDTIMTRKLQTIHGCDSIVTLDLKMERLYCDTIYATIEAGEYYNANGFCECDEGSYIRYFASQYGCDSVLHLFLQVNSESDLYVPNCITPLSPTTNRFKIVHDQSFIIDDVYIYNRAGEMVFHSPDNIEAWDGRYKGSYCPQAAYTYVIYYNKVGSNERKEKVGTIVLLY